MNKTWIDQCPLHVVDVGASGGIHPRWSKIANRLKPILFEPDAREYTRLRANTPKEFELLNTALSDHTGELELYLTRKQQNSSVYMPNLELLRDFPDSERFQVEKRVKVPCDTLDRQLGTRGLTDIDFIKLDAQGYELPILQGASRTLDRVIGVEVEVEFCEMYKNQPLFGDVDAFLRKKGFWLFDLKRYYWKKTKSDDPSTRKGNLIFADALYFREIDEILSWKELSSEKAARVMMVFLAYGYHNLAETFCSSARKNGKIQGAAEQELRAMLDHHAKGLVLADFRGKSFAHRSLSKLARLFTNKTWYSVDLELGNN